jgi:hypothetical protein
MFRGAVLLLGSLLGALVAELVGRSLVPDVFLQRRMRAGGLFVPYEPGVQADLLADEFRVRFEGNRFGFRDRLDRRELPSPGRQRILLLGDSFSAGWGVELRETYAYRLEDSLGVDVLNASKSGGCPLWYVAQAREFLPRFRPDLLLVQVYDNDPQDDLDHRDRFGVGPDGRLGELPQALRQEEGGVRDALSHWWRGLVVPRRVRAVSRWLRGRAPLVRSPFVRPGALPDHRVLTRAEASAKYDVDTSPGAARPYHDPARPDAWREAFALQRSLLGQLLEETSARGVDVVVLYIPNVHLLLARQPPERLASGNPHGELLREVCQERGVTLVDGTALLGDVADPAALYFAHDGHLNGDGHAHLALALAPRLKAALARAR